MVICESCQKSLEPEKILRHIGNRKAWKDYYGPRLLELKSRKESDRKQKSYENLTLKERENLNKKRRERYLKTKEKKKDKSQRKKQENIDWASKGVNCDGIAKEDIVEDDNVKDDEAQCGFCSKALFAKFYALFMSLPASSFCPKREDQKKM